LPYLASSPEIHERSSGITGSELDGPSSLRVHRPQQRALVLLGDFAELATGTTRLVDIADHEHDLDVCGEQARTFQALAGLPHDSADGRSRRGAVSLRKP